MREGVVEHGVLVVVGRYQAQTVLRVWAVHPVALNFDLHSAVHRGKQMLFLREEPGHPVAVLAADMGNALAGGLELVGLDEVRSLLARVPVDNLPYGDPPAVAAVERYAFARFADREAHRAVA